MPLSASRVLRTFRYAMYFNGVNAYVDVPGFSWGVLQNGFTIMMWLNPAQKDSDWVIHSSAPLGYFRIVYFFNGEYLGLVTRDSCNNELLQLGTGWYSVPPLTFTSVAFWWNVSTLKAYINAVLNTQTADTRANKCMGYTGLRIARALYAGYGQGYLTQLLIYSTTISDSDIAWNYLYPDNPVRSGLVLWLQAHPAYIKDIDGDGVLEWMDLSGFNNHGKIYGATLVELVKTAKRVLTPARVLRATR